MINLAGFFFSKQIPQKAKPKATLNWSDWQLEPDISYPRVS